MKFKQKISTLLIISLFLSCVSVFAQPANDDCASPIEIVISDNNYGLGEFYSDSIDLTDATLQLMEYFHGSQLSAGTDKKSIWYSFSLPTARAIRIELLQPSMDIPENGAGFTVFKASSCLPGSAGITDAKLTPINKFGETYNPCLKPGDYMIQVGGNDDADDSVYIKLTSSMTESLDEADSTGNPYDFSTLVAGWQTADYDVGCQTTVDENDTCAPNVGTDYLEYTQNTWHVFTTDDYVDFIRLLLREKAGMYTSDFKVSYYLYKGDAITAPGSLDLIDSAVVFEHDNENNPPYKDYLCDDDIIANTTYSLKIFWHRDYSNSIQVSIYERGLGVTEGGDPSALPAAHQLGVLASDADGEWTLERDTFSCEGLISENPCDTANPDEGYIEFYAGWPTTYRFATWYTFTISAASNVKIKTNYKLLKRLYKVDITDGCGVQPVKTFSGGEYRYTCMAAGDYSLQILGRLDTDYLLNSHYGEDASLNIEVTDVSTSNLFPLDAVGEVDSINKNGGSWDPLADGVKYYSTSSRFDCNNTVLPSDVCSAGWNKKAMYRVFIIGDGDGDAVDDNGILTVGGGNYWRFSYKLYKGDVIDRAIYQNKYSYGETIDSLTDLIGCQNLRYGIPVCVTPGKYTLVSYGDTLDVNSSDQPWVQFDIVNSDYSDPSTPEDLGDITSALASGSVTSESDYWDCVDNPLTLDGRSACSHQTKQIYRQFYISSQIIINISKSSGGSFSVFAGKITDGTTTLNDTISSDLGWLGCLGSYAGNVCKPFPAGWYTVVCYADGGTYAGTPYCCDETGDENHITISKTDPPISPQYNRPYKASDEGTVQYLANYGTADYPQNVNTYTFNTETFNCIDDTPFANHGNVASCDAPTYNRVAYYSFTLTQEAYVRIKVQTDYIKAQVYDVDLTTDSNLTAKTPIQECVQMKYLSTDGCSNRMWGEMEFCRMQAGTYALVCFASDWHINKTITPLLTIDSVGTSRYDHVLNAYDFDSIPGDSTFYYEKYDDVTAGRVSSYDFISCKTGAWSSDPKASGALYCFEGSDPKPADTSSITYATPTNEAHYDGTLNYPIRRNLWYSFKIYGAGSVTIQVNNKTPGSSANYPWAVYYSDEDGDLSFTDLKNKVAGSDVDSTYNQGLSTVISSSYMSWWCGCGGNSVEKYFTIDPCGVEMNRRYYLVVDAFDALRPNAQVEVGVKFEPTSNMELLYDKYYQSNVINVVDSGVYVGDTGNFACATTDAHDQNSCGSRTLWYKIEAEISGNIYLNYDILGHFAGTYYSASGIVLMREIIEGDSTSTGLEVQTLTSTTVDGVPWGYTCFSPGTYYIMVTGCGYYHQQVIPNIWLQENDGDLCTTPVLLEQDEPGTSIGSTVITCHTIGEGYGEDSLSPIMGCLYGPTGYKSTWFRVDLNYDKKVDMSFQLSENTTALPDKIRYRVMYGTCSGMTTGPCNTDALTEFTINCMESDNNSYFVQVVMPENATGDISLTVRTDTVPDPTCAPFDPLAPIANFYSDTTCGGDSTCFTNQSSAGDSITYAWDFGYDGPDGDPDNETSTIFSPCHLFPTPAANSVSTYTVTLIVTNVEVDLSDTVARDIIIYSKPTINILDSISGTPNTVLDGLVTTTDLVDFWSDSANTISDPATTFYWDFGDGTSSTDVNPQDKNYTELGGVIVVLTVRSGTCIVEDRDTFTVGMEPIFDGGEYDGVGGYRVEEVCIVEEIFDGGDYDGAGAYRVEEVCITEGIFDGGDYDGAGAYRVEAVCEVESIFDGGDYDGSHAYRIEVECPLESIFDGGYYDGHSKFHFTSATNDDYTIVLSDDTICSGESVNFTVTDVGLTIDYVRYMNGTTELALVSSAPFHYNSYTPSSNDEHIIANVAAECDTFAHDFYITVINNVSADAGDDQDLCTGETAVLGTADTDPLHNFAWAPGTNLSSTTIAQPTVSPTSTVTYTLTVSDATGECASESDQVIVNFTTSPTIDDIISDTAICPNDVISLTSSVTSDSVWWFYEYPTFEYKLPIILTPTEPTDLLSSIPDGSLTGDHCCGTLEADKSRFSSTTSFSIVATNPDLWIKADLGSQKPVDSIGTKGRGNSAQWVKTYKISYSNDDAAWTFVGGADLASATEFTGNTDQNTIVINDFSFTAQYIRLHPYTYQTYNSLRWEIYSSPNTPLTNLVTKFTVNTNTLISQGKMQSDGSDIRVLDSDGSTDIDFWVADGTINTTSTEIWVEIPACTTYTDKTIYMTYGDPSLSSAGNGDNVFVFFDDFNDGTIDAAKWDDGAGFSESDGYLHGTTTGTDDTYRLKSDAGFTGDYIFETRHYGTVEATNGHHGGGWTSSSSDGYYVLLHPTNTWYTRDDGSWNGATSYTYMDNWIRMELSVEGSTADAIITRESDGGYLTKTDAANSGLTGDKLTFGRRNDASYNSQAYTAKWDWVYVRDYSETESTSSTGTETVKGINVLVRNEDLTGIDSTGYFVLTVKSGSCDNVSDTVDVSNNTAITIFRWRSDKTGNWTASSTWEVYNATKATPGWEKADSYTGCGAPTYPDSRDSTIEIQSGHTVTVDDAIDYGVDELTINGTLLIPDGKTFTMVDSSSSAVVADVINNGNLTITGTFAVEGTTPKLDNDDNSTVTYNHTSAQTMINSGRIVDKEYGKLVVEGGSVKTVSGSNTKVVTSVLFTSGHIQLDIRNFIIGEDAVINGYAYNTGFFITNSSGSLIKESMGSGTGDIDTFIFPIGTAANSSSYNMAKVVNTGTSDDIYLRVVADFEDHAAFPADELIETTSVDRTWYMSEKSDGNSSIELTVYWAASHEAGAFDETSCNIGEFVSGSGWTRLGATAAALGTGTDAAPRYKTYSPISALTKYSVGSCSMTPSKYRTIADGDWTDESIWEVYSTVSEDWVAPEMVTDNCGQLSFPTSESDSVFVRHTVEYDSSLAIGVDQVFMNEDAIINIGSAITFNLVNGNGIDLDNDGKMVITGTFSAAASTTVNNNEGSIVHYNGDNQDVMAFDFASLWIDGTQSSAASVKSLSEDITVHDTLTFINGMLTLLSYDLSLDSNTILSGITLGSATKGYVKADSSGTVIKTFVKGTNVANYFPIGGASYSPANVDFDEVTTKGTLSAKLREIKHPNLASSLVLQRYWTITQGTVVFSGEYDATLYYLDVDLPETPANSTEEAAMVEIGCVYSGSSWKFSPSSITNAINTTMNNAVIRNNSFSDFTLGPDTTEVPEPLPVEMLLVEAKWKDSEALVHWVTMSEINNAGFEIQRSTDAENFAPIGYLEGIGNSTQRNDYFFIDEDINDFDEEIIYYRLKQFDYNGAIEYSNLVFLKKVKATEIVNEIELLSIHPNPVKRGDVITLNYYTSSEKEAIITIYDLYGKVVHEGRLNTLEGINELALPTANLQAAGYMIKIAGESNEKAIHAKFVVY